jgi:hypothetical protein
VRANEILALEVKIWQCGDHANEADVEARRQSERAEGDQIGRKLPKLRLFGV